MGNTYGSIRNYEVDIDDQFYKVTKETAMLIKKAVYECDTKYSVNYENEKYTRIFTTVLLNASVFIAG